MHPETRFMFRCNNGLIQSTENISEQLQISVWLPLGDPASQGHVCRHLDMLDAFYPVWRGLRKVWILPRLQKKHWTVVYPEGWMFLLWKGILSFPGRDWLSSLWYNNNLNWECVVVMSHSDVGNAKPGAEEGPWHCNEWRVCVCSHRVTVNMVWVHIPVRVLEIQQLVTASRKLAKKHCTA